MAASSTEPQGSEPAASKEEARRRITRITYWSLPFLVVFGVWNLIPSIPNAWRFAVMPVEIVFVVVYGTAVIRFSLWQRDEYWRERGRDPKHPECFPKDHTGGESG
ncbi:hypothetical protein [Arthrobacter sp. NicSoilC5]|uniref:hypothetical protein n=1 Tax=Arthrobacter sp. NicSoilC5 TaxID=2831000 RepID=UPI001CC79192|nr:hypothetical protein [Arthrobacter sp. NicSoilC5]BCW78897.1 hypothetical protein NicSoilC5_09160 [Arthrobacter sp. NicSoilC5]